MPKVVFKKLDKIYDSLYLDHECAGTLIEKDDKIEKITVVKGDSDSVATPLSKYNWHSHPLILYIREGVSWGWPSGEDMREVRTSTEKVTKRGDRIQDLEIGNNLKNDPSLMGAFPIQKPE